VAPGQPRIEGAGLDFRDEIMAQIYDRGDVRPKRTLTFNIDVTDDGETRGPSFRERRTFRNWRRIGTITFDRAVVSYNGGLLQPNKIKLLVSVRKHFESFESFVIQSGDLIREGHHQCGRRRTADVTTAANCDIRVT
jgi:hypothetical protein